jgi:CHAT domain-containing protein/tetratricopeptide (TPR) repeat protein
MNQQRVLLSLMMVAIVGIADVYQPHISSGQTPATLNTQQKTELQQAKSLNNEAMKLFEQGQYGAAEPLYLRALAIREKVLGKDHPNTALSLNNLAAVYESQGKYEAAEPLFLRALAINEQVLGKDHPTTAASLNNLAALYKSQGKYGAAEPLYLRALAINEKVLGQDYPDTAISLNNLALLYDSQGKYAAAEPLFLRALAIREKVWGKDHPTTAIGLNNLALLYDSQGKYRAAEPLYLRALAIKEKVLGKDHPTTALSLNNLAAVYDSQGKYRAAEPLYLRALAIEEKVLGKDHPTTALSLNNLAAVYESQGKYGAAEPLYLRALAINEKVLGKDHPTTATSLENLAHLYTSQGKYEAATEFMQLGLEVEEKNLARNLVYGSESTKQSYLATLSSSVDASVSLAFKSENSSAANRLALNTVLRRKGRVLETLAGSIGILRQQLKKQPQVQSLLDLWQSNIQVEVALSQKDLSNDTNRANYQTAQKTRQQSEAELGAKSIEFRTVVKSVTIAEIQQQKQIPSNAALVEIVAYKPLVNSKAIEKGLFGGQRYAAAVIRSTGEPQWIDLGTRASIDKTIAEFRVHLTNSATDSNFQRNTVARTLYNQVVQPLTKYLGTSEHLLLSPDGALNSIPFEALKDEENKYLIERYQFSYLTSGRDLRIFPIAPTSNRSPVVFADIDYDRANSVATKIPLSIYRSPDLSSRTFTRLETTIEAQQITTTFPNTKVFSKQAATKAALQQVDAPFILHLATHGFFLNAPTVGAASQSENRTQQADNPLLRSGLVLAGANQHQHGEGIITAQEVTALNLHGTQLVVLSACQTGLGDISIGEGIYGLRRALVMSGSQSQVLSLWSVKNDATTELMRIFYQNLQRKMPRHEALRQAQLALMRSANYQNPHYWAAFIPSGNWTLLPN